MIRTAVLSFWHVHVKGYMRQANEHPDVELVAAWDEDPVRGRERAAEVGLPFYENLDELLASDEIDAVIVQCATSLHEEVITKAARAGKHVLSDKVLAPTLAEAHRIVKATDDANVVLVTGLVAIYHDYINTMKSIIESGELGRIVNVRMMSCHGMAVDNALPPGFFSPEEAAGGAVIDMCHVLYALPHLLGSSPETVYAQFYNITDRQVEDQAVVICDFADGSHANLEISFSTKAAPRMEIEVNGTEGTLHFRADAHPGGTGAPNGALFLKAVGDPANFEPIGFGEQQTTPFKLWVEHIKSGTRPDHNIDQAIELSRMNEATYLSAARGEKVRLDSIAD
jgi:1,5-anhydro-D-fructose reductase (1,5-anhydro-D-mannitol-forming)